MPTQSRSMIDVQIELRRTSRVNRVFFLAKSQSLFLTVGFPGVGEGARSSRDYFETGVEIEAEALPFLVVGTGASRKLARDAVWQYTTCHMASPAESQVANLLGGRRVLGGIADAAGFVLAVRRGLPYASLEALTGALQADLGEVGEVVGIAARTLARRKHEQQLSPIESDRLYRIAHVMHLAASTLGGLDHARLWLRRNNRGLGGSTPLSLLDTEIGARQVEEVLLRLSHGMYA